MGAADSVSIYEFLKCVVIEAKEKRGGAEQLQASRGSRGVSIINCRLTKTHCFLVCELAGFLLPGASRPSVRALGCQLLLLLPLCHPILAPAAEGGDTHKTPTPTHTNVCHVAHIWHVAMSHPALTCPWAPWSLPSACCSTRAVESAIGKAIQRPPPRLVRRSSIEQLGVRYFHTICTAVHVTPALQHTTSLS